MNALLPLIVLALAPSEALDAPPPKAPLGLDAIDMPSTSAPLVSPYTQDEEEAPEYGWALDFQLGASLSTGTAETIGGSTAFNAFETQEHYRNEVRFWWSYQQDKNASPSISQRRSGLSAEHRRFLSEKTYWLLNGQADNDLAAGIDLRYFGGVGIGRQFKDTETYKFSGDAGINYYHEEFRGGIENEYPAARLSYTSHWTPNDRYEILHIGYALPSLEDVGTSNWSVYAKLDTTAKVNLSANMFAALQWILDWNRLPAPGFKQANNRFFLTVGWSI